MHFETEQEAFWAGTFGDEYVDRNKGALFLASKLAIWTNVVRKLGGGNLF